MPLSVSQMITDSRPSPPAGNREERLLAGRLTGARPAVPLGSVIEAARRHRVHLLLAASMTPDERVTTDGAALARELTVAAALDLWRADDTQHLLEALTSSGIDVLLLKGTGLAYTAYAEPHLRPRLDVDVVIGREQVEGSVVGAPVRRRVSGWAGSRWRPQKRSSPGGGGAVRRGATRSSPSRSATT